MVEESPWTDMDQQDNGVAPNAPTPSFPQTPFNMENFMGQITMNVTNMLTKEVTDFKQTLVEEVKKAVQTEMEIVKSNILSTITIGEEGINFLNIYKNYRG